MKELPTITAEDLLRFDPCYRYEKRQELFTFARSKERWNALEILDCVKYPLVDRFWLVLRKDLIPEPLLHEAACRFIEHCLRGRSPDVKLMLRKSIAAKRAWLRDKVSDVDLISIKSDLYRFCHSLIGLGGQRAFDHQVVNACRWALSFNAECAARDTAILAASDEVRVELKDVLIKLLKQELAK